MYVKTHRANLYLINADKSGLVQLTDDTSDDWALAWSPDGDRIAFVSIRGDTAGIYAMVPVGSNVVRLAVKGNRSYPPLWSPDGASIVLVTWGGEDQSVYRVSADVSGPPVLLSSKLDGWKPLWVQ